MSEETGTYLKSWGSTREIRGSQGAGTLGEARGGGGGALISFPIRGCPEWWLRPLEFPFLVSVESQSMSHHPGRPHPASPVGPRPSCPPDLPAVRGSPCILGASSARSLLLLTPGFLVFLLIPQWVFLCLYNRPAGGALFSKPRRLIG